MLKENEAYWNKDYIIANREAFAKVLFDWYSKNPYTYDLSSQMKWKRIELKRYYQPRKAQRNPG